MAKETKAPQRPTRQARIRVCGKWQKPDYVPDAEEQKAWETRCKDRDWNPKTGKPNVKKEAAKKK